MREEQKPRRREAGGLKLEMQRKQYKESKYAIQ
jgi:hypothetical protein